MVGSRERLEFVVDLRVALVAREGVYTQHRACDRVKEFVANLIGLCVSIAWYEFRTFLTMEG